MGSSNSGGSTASTTIPSSRSSKGGIGPQNVFPSQGRYAPLKSTRGFNVNEAAAGGLEQAMQGAQAGMAYRPQSVSPTGYDAAQMGPAGQVADTNLSAYTNPYETQVVDQSLADLERSRLMQQNQLGAQASAAGAFGGSRQGIAEAETNRAFAEQAARTASGLRQGGFQQAQQLAQFDIGQLAATEAANVAAQNQASQFGAQQGMTAQQLNQAAGLQGAQQSLAAASQLGQLGQQAFNTGQAIQQQQAQQGLMQQGLQQALIDAAIGQYQGFTSAPQQALQLPLMALGAQPDQSTTTGTSTGMQQKNPGLFDYLSLGATAMSDKRLKKNVRPLDKVGNVSFYSWDWNDEGKKIADPAQPTFGVMADELQETHPHLVKRGDDGYLRVNYSGLMSELEAA